MFRASSHKARLGDLLVRRRLISAAQLEDALQVQRQSGQKLGQVLIEQGLISPQQLKRMLSQQRLQHWTASVMLACGTLVTGLPKIATAQPIAPSFYAELKNSSQATTGESGLKHQAIAVAPLWNRPVPQSPQDVDSIPLAANPTESSPLLGFCHPLQEFGLKSQGFRGVTHQGRMAYAMDYQISLGTPVYAMRSGRVIGIEDRFADTGGGADKVYEFNYILVEHQGGYRSAYLHLQQGFIRRASVKVGDYVSAGQLIGYSGNSGWSSGPHLHVEIQKASPTGTFGETVPFKMGRSCQTPSVVIASQDNSSLQIKAQGGSGGSIISSSNLSTVSTEATQAIGTAVNLPESAAIPPQAVSPTLACTTQGCGCQACLQGTEHLQNLAQNTTVSRVTRKQTNPLTRNRLEALLRSP